jgi:hypothetical protein
MSKVVIQGNASGTGDFTIAAPNSNTNRTLTLPDETGTVLSTATAGVPVNGPAFSYYQSSAQTLASSTTTKLTFTTSEFDTTGGMFASSTFTPTVAGYYQASGGLQVAASATVMVIYLYKNGTLYKQLVSSNPSTLSGGYGSALVYLNGSTDYIEIYANLATGQALNATAANVYFQAAMIRSGV